MVIVRCATLAEALLAAGLVASGPDVRHG
jgi:hypothetical protein